MGYTPTREELQILADYLAVDVAALADLVPPRVGVNEAAGVPAAHQDLWALAACGAEGPE